MPARSSGLPVTTLAVLGFWCVTCPQAWPSDTGAVQQLVRVTVFDRMMRSEAEEAAFISDRLPDILPPELRSGFRNVIDTSIEYNRMSAALVSAAAPNLRPRDVEADAGWWASSSGREIANAESSIYAALFEGSTYDAYNPQITPLNPNNDSLVNDVIQTSRFPAFVVDLMLHSGPARSCFLKTVAVPPTVGCAELAASAVMKEGYETAVAPVARDRYLRVPAEDLKAYLAYLKSAKALERLAALRSAAIQVDSQRWHSASLRANAVVDTYARAHFGHVDEAAIRKAADVIDAGSGLPQAKLTLALMNRGGPPNAAVLAQLTRVTLKEARDRTVDDSAPSVPQLDKESLEQAQRYIDQSLALDPARAETLMLSGHVAYLRFQFQHSVELLEKAKALGAQSAWLPVNLGDAYWALAMSPPPVNRLYTQQASEQFEAALSTDLPKAAEDRVVHQLGPVYAELGDLKKADTYYRRYASSRTGRNRAYALHRYSHFLLFYADDDDAALAAIREAVEVQSFAVGREFLVELLTIKAGHLVMAGRLREAAPLLDEARHLKPDLEATYPDLAQFPKLFPGVIGIHSASNGAGFSGRIAGQTLVHACLYATSAQIKTLLSWGADANFLDPDEGTPLHVAILADNREAVQALLASGANPLTPFIDGRLPSQLESATSTKREAILTLVRKAAGSAVSGGGMLGTPLKTGFEYKVTRTLSGSFNGRDWGDKFVAGEHFVFHGECKFEDASLACFLVKGRDSQVPRRLAIGKEQLANWTEWFREIGPAKW